MYSLNCKTFNSKLVHHFIEQKELENFGFIFTYKCHLRIFFCINILIIYSYLHLAFLNNNRKENKNDNKNIRNCTTIFSYNTFAYENVNVKKKKEY